MYTIAYVRTYCIVAIGDSRRFSFHSTRTAFSWLSRRQCLKLRADTAELTTHLESKAQSGLYYSLWTHFKRLMQYSFSLPALSSKHSSNYSTRYHQFSEIPSPSWGPNMKQAEGGQSETPRDQYQSTYIALLSSCAVGRRQCSKTIHSAMQVDYRTLAMH